MNPRTAERSLIEGPAGALEIVVNAPPGQPAGIALVAHPHPLQGGTLDNKVAQTLARAFFEMNYAAVRFNFRGVGASAGSFDDGIGETDDALAALAHARARFGELPLALAGFSFGTHVQLRVAEHVAFERMVLVGPAVTRFSGRAVPGDTVVIHGEVDDVVPLANVLAWANPLQLPIMVLAGAGHFFHGRLPQLARVVTALYRAAPLA